MKFESTFHATEDDARRVLERVNAFVAGHVDAPDKASELVIVISEAVNNVVEHAYAQIARQDVHLKLQVLRNKAVVDLRDNGHPFPQHLLGQKTLPRTEVQLDDMPEGGFGWPVIHALVDEISHERDTNENRLSFSMSL